MEHIPGTAAKFLTFLQSISPRVIIDKTLHPSTELCCVLAGFPHVLQQSYLCSPSSGRCITIRMDTTPS